MLAEVFIYDSPAQMLAAERTWHLLLLVFSFWSLWTSYRGYNAVHTEIGNKILVPDRAGNRLSGPTTLSEMELSGHSSVGWALPTEMNVRLEIGGQCPPYELRTITETRIPTHLT